MIVLRPAGSFSTDYIRLAKFFAAEVKNPPKTWLAVYFVVWVVLGD